MISPLRLIVLALTLLSSNTLFPVLIRVERLSKDGKNIYLLSIIHDTKKDVAIEGEQLEEFMNVLEILDKQGEPITIYLEQAHPLAKFSTPNPVFLSDTEVQVEIKNLKNVRVEDIEVRRSSIAINSLLRSRGYCWHPGGHFFDEKSPKCMNDLVFKDLEEEHDQCIQEVSKVFESNPHTVPDIWRYLEKGKKGFALLKEKIAALNISPDQSVLKTAGQLTHEQCDDLADHIRDTMAFLLDLNCISKVVIDELAPYSFIIAGSGHIDPINDLLFDMDWEDGDHAGPNIGYGPLPKQSIRDVLLSALTPQKSLSH